jgi:DNA-binding IscR family transcriptional regulator
MQVSRDFTIAVHTLLCISYFSRENKVTSDFIASSVGVNPVIIRNLLIKLKNAGLIEVKAGTGGATLAKEAKKITFLDIYHAAGCDEKPMSSISMSTPTPSAPSAGTFMTCSTAASKRCRRQ